MQQKKPDLIGLFYFSRLAYHPQKIPITVLFKSFILCVITRLFPFIFLLSLLSLGADAIGTIRYLQA